MVYKSHKGAVIASIMVTAVIGFANLFTIAEPTLTSPEGISKTITMLAGPLLFAIIGFVLFTIYEKKYGKKSDKNDKLAG